MNKIAITGVGLGILGIITAIITVIIFGPIFSIWSLNLLFGLGIPVTFKTWCATLWLAIVVSGTVKASSK